MITLRRPAVMHLSWLPTSHAPEGPTPSGASAGRSASASAAPPLPLLPLSSCIIWYRSSCVSKRSSSSLPSGCGACDAPTPTSAGGACAAKGGSGWAAPACQGTRGASRAPASLTNAAGGAGGGGAGTASGNTSDRGDDCSKPSAHERFLGSESGKAPMTDAGTRCAAEPCTSRAATNAHWGSWHIARKLERSRT